LPESHTWRTLDYDSLIEDPRLVRPLAVSALLDAAKADHAVIEALAAKGDPTLQGREDKARSEGKAEGREEGRLEGRAESVLTLLEMRGIAVSMTQRQEILSCLDLARLDFWLYRASLASSIDEVLSEP
jgi:flagellar biosynthesis/type III secretory pathway protein FliH